MVARIEKSIGQMAHATSYRHRSRTRRFGSMLGWYESLW